MKKLIIISVLAMLIMVFSLLSLSYGAEQPEFVIKAEANQPKGLPIATGIEYFKKLVEERSNGRIKVDVFLDGVLGSNRDTIEAVQLGVIEITVTVNSVLSSWVPSLNLFELPFLFKNPDHHYAVLESDIAMDFDKELSEKGFHLLGYFVAGVRHIMTVKKVINSIEDLKGLKIRVMSNPVLLDAFKAFGASPLPMAYSELYTALQTGAIDGADAANSNYFAKKFYEVAPHWAFVSWMSLTTPMIINKAFYDNLPADLQKIVEDSAKEACIMCRELYRTADDDCFELIKEAGVQITYPDREPFMKASELVYTKWASKVGGHERIDAIRNFKY